MANYKFELAQRYSHQGQHNLAIETLKELLAEDPEQALYHGMLAANLLAKRRLHAAEYEIGIAVRLNPNISYFYHVMARIRMMQNKPKKALAFCDDALRLDPENIDALLCKYEIYLQQDSRQQAFSCIEQAAQIAPNSIEVFNAFGEFYLKAGKLSQAEQYARDALSANAQNEDSNILMGEIQLAKGNIAEADYHAKFVIMHNPDSVAALTLLSNIKMRKNLIFGLWWRFNSKIATMTNIRGSLVLISAFLFFTLCAQILRDLGYSEISLIVSYSWLALVIYSWVAIPYFYRSLEKELSNFAFNRNF